MTIFTQFEMSTNIFQISKVFIVACLIIFFIFLQIEFKLMTLSNIFSFGLDGIDEKFKKKKFFFSLFFCFCICIYLVQLLFRIVLLKSHILSYLKENNFVSFQFYYFFLALNRVKVEIMIKLFNNNFFFFFMC